MEITPICIKCKNYIKKGTCKAFNSIPSKIWSEGNDHSNKLKDQVNNIVFEPLNNG